MMLQAVWAVLCGGVVGLLIGLILAWGIWPVQWTDADPSFLRSDFMEDYLRMAIDSNTLRPDPAVAKQRFEILGEQVAEAFAQIQTNPETVDPANIAAFNEAVSGFQPPVTEPASNT